MISSKPHSNKKAERNNENYAYISLITDQDREREY